MPEEQIESISSDLYMRHEWRNWQRWSMVILALGIVGAGLTAYTAITSGTGHSAERFIPPILYAGFAVLVLGNFYMVQREALLKGVHDELVRQRIEAELNRELALMDPVTEVYNRRYARVILRREVSRAKRYHMGLSVLLVDITGFRKVNESLGQAGGDLVLRQVAHVLQTRIRNSDIIVRFGGDEFLLVLTDSEPTGVDQLAVRLKSGLRDWANSSGLAEFKLDFAMGVAHYTDDVRVDEMLNLAESRMRKDTTGKGAAVRS